MSEMNRRSFLKNSAVAGSLALAAQGCATTDKRTPVAVTTPRRGPNEEIRVACIGFRGQGASHVHRCTNTANVRVATLCDTDENVWPKGLRIVDESGKPEPKTEFDMRRVFDDKDIDAVTIATPNHTHALATVWACQAGKDVYVEKPCSHNIFEGRQIVAAAKKYNRVVQHGTQARSINTVRQAMKLLHEGVIGDVYMARALCYKPRNSIGFEEDQPTPEGVHYDLWLGPAEKRPFNPNRYHYNWHWFFEYGNGDIGNQGVHQMDIARWGLDRGLPVNVCSMGGRYTYDDQANTPNTLATTMQYDDGTLLTFEVRGRQTNREWDVQIGNLFYGSNGVMAIRGTGGPVEIMVDGQPGPKVEAEGIDHIANWLDVVRSRETANLTAPPEEGRLSSALCHLANISYKVGHSLNFDPKRERFTNSNEANRLLTRNYRDPFVVPRNV